MRHHIRVHPLCAALMLSGIGAAQAAGTGFTYQGLLEDSGTPAASYDFEIALFDTACDSAPCGGATLGAALFRNDVALSDGRFTLELDFGDAFTGAERFLELRVRRGSESGGFTQLLPRQRLAATPYSQHAQDADFAAQVAASSISTTELANGAVNVSKIDTSTVQARVSGNCASGAVNAINADGTVGCETFSGNFWSRSGNAGTNPSVDFLGTTDAVALEFRTEGRASVRLFPVAIGSTTNVVIGSPENAAVSSARGATVSGGGAASADPDLNIGAGGAPNQAFSHYVTISGGLANQAGQLDPDPLLGAGATVGGGVQNSATGLAGTIGGGQSNVASGNNSSVAGGFSNDALGSRSAIGGGENNSAGGFATVVGGGASNNASGDNTTIAGGSSNTASQLSATVGGGSLNTANQLAATVAGGSSNTAGGVKSTVSGGENNSTHQGFATVSGGNGNTASGITSIAPGGEANCAGGRFSLAAGRRAKVRPGLAGAVGTACSGLATTGTPNGDEGSFVWADSSNFNFSSTATNQFSARAVGGVRFVTAIDGSGVETAGVKLDNGDSAWEVLSDRNAKAGIEAVDPRDMLAGVLALPIYRWHYRSQSPDIRHVGPMAQDFHVAFGLNGDDDKSISTIDPDGVALAAIQGLNQRLEAEVAALRAELAALRARLDPRDAGTVQ